MVLGLLVLVLAGCALLERFNPGLTVPKHALPKRLRWILFLMETSNNHDRAAMWKGLDPGDRNQIRKFFVMERERAKLVDSAR